MVHVFSSPEPSDDEVEENDYFSDASEHFSDESDHSMEESDYSPESDASQEEMDYCSEASDNLSEVIGNYAEAKDMSIERSDVDDESWYTQFMLDLRHFSDTPASTCTRTNSASQSPESHITVASSYPALPKTATVTQYLKELNKLVFTGPPQSSRNYRPFYQRRSRWHKVYVHAELIERDKYGVDAMHACKECVKRGQTCRIYHPAMHESPWIRGVKGHAGRMGMKCSACRISHCRTRCDAA